MPEFIAKDPNAEVMGFMVQSYIAALGKEIAPIAARFGLNHIDPQGWVKQQVLLDLLKEAAEGDMKAVFDMVKVGMRSTEMVMGVFELPPTIESFFMSIPESLQQAYRGDAVGEYRATLIRSGHLELYVCDPVPCDLNYGAAYAATRLTRPQDCSFVVTHRPGSCRHTGDDYCIYDIKWWKEEEDEDETPTL